MDAVGDRSDNPAFRELLSRCEVMRARSKRLMDDAAELAHIADTLERQLRGEKLPPTGPTPSAGADPSHPLN